MTSGLLVTKHHKVAMVSPPLEAIGWEIESFEADTDALGTFCGDVPRLVSPLETARQKALLGAAMGDQPWLLASEGSINHCFGGIHRDVEIVVAVDRSQEVSVVGSAVGIEIFCARFVVGWDTSEEEILKKCLRRPSTSPSGSRLQRSFD